MEPKVTLISWTKDPVETIYLLWEASRTNKPMPTVEELRARYPNDAQIQSEVRSTFRKVVDSAIPVSENINFVFLLENVSVSFREQMVRHRIGVKVGERLGVDMFPDIHDSTWWSQSMRVLDMSKFAENGEYRVPDSIKEHPEMLRHFKIAMREIEATYSLMLNSGIPVEDAREVLPLSTLHRVSWGINLGALTHILHKRGCWILQLGLWGPIIKGMVEELATKVDPYFRTLIQPPCVKGDKFVGCNVQFDNEKRIKREDPLPPCSLFLRQHKMLEVTHNPDVAEIPAHLLESWVGTDRLPKYEEMKKEYGPLWGRDVHTGKTTV